jgi:hypothetical protein
MGGHYYEKMPAAMMTWLTGHIRAGPKVITPDWLSFARIELAS